MSKDVEGIVKKLLSCRLTRCGYIEADGNMGGFWLCGMTEFGLVP